MRVFTLWITSLQLYGNINNKANSIAIIAVTALKASDVTTGAGEKTSN